ncbi:MAG: RHS repeat-associated core domain-containing protein [Nitrosomonas sp.]
MTGNLIFDQSRQLLIGFLVFPCIANANVYGVERGPITIAPGPPHLYTTSPQSACEYSVHGVASGLIISPYNYLLSPAVSEILEVFADPRNQNGYPSSSGPIFAYLCSVKISQYMGPSAPRAIGIVNNVGSVYPICNVGDPVSTINNETICTTPSHIPDKGANAGQPQLGSCIGNPVNTATGNKYAEETDIANSSGLSFSRHYNATSLSGGSQVGTSWNHSFQRSLTVNPQTITATRSDGKTAYFRLVNSVWINQQAGGDRIAQTNNPKGWRLITSDDEVEAYNTSGKLLSISSRDGRTQTLGYDTNGRLSTVTDDVGRTLSFTYDGSSRIQTLTDPAGGVTQYGYDASSNLTSVTYPDGKVRTYHYNEQAYTSNTNLPHALTGITDENSVRFAIYTYDAQGRAVVTEHAGGVERYVLGYSSDGSNTMVTDPLGSQYTHHFQTILGVAKSTGQSQPAGSGCSAAASNMTYDINGNIVSSTDFNNHKTCYAYDLNRNLETARVEGLSSDSNCPADLIGYTPAVDSSERKIITEWHASFRLPTLIREAKRETLLAYDTHGNVTQYQLKDTTTNNTRTWITSYVYHPSIPGVILQKTENGPRTDVSDITTYNYYAPDASCVGGHLGCRGQVASITNALGHATDITRYNAHGQPEEIYDANDLVTTLAYDNRQRLTTKTVGSEVTSYQYDNAGQIKRITSPDTSYLNFTYDAAHRLTTIADNLGNRIQYTLDNMGNRTQEEIFDPANNLAQRKTREFDALNRLWKDIGAQSQTTQYQYDAQGNLKQVSDPLQHATQFQFDALNRLTQTIDATNHRTQQQHNSLDQLTQVTDPRNVATSYTTNGFGDVTQEISPDRGTTTYTYDSAGNIKTITDARGVKQTYTWDALNRPTKRTHTTVTGVPNITALTWNYDNGANGNGRLTGITDQSGTTTYSYDAHGRLLTKTQITKFNTLSFTQSLSYQYDAMGKLQQVTYPSGTQITTTYGADGRPSELRINGNALISNITYHPFGEPKSWVWGNGQAYTRSFDLDGRLKNHPTGSDTRTLNYDSASRITQTADTNPIYNRSFDYDVNNRLTNQSDNTSFKIWSYDANSNRTQYEAGSATYAYTIANNSNRLQTVSGPITKNYTYDAAGNPKSDGQTTFTWNAGGKLASTLRSGKIHTYKTNAFDQRISKHGPLSQRFFFFYDSTGQLIGEYRNNAETTTPTDDWLVRQETVWLGDIPVAVIKKPTATSTIQLYYVYADHLNTPRVIVNSRNTTIWRWDNVHAFGANLPFEDPDNDGQTFEYNSRFPGQYFDKETNLHYNYFRYYEPETGRYISPDPIGLAGGVNVWGYVEANPLDKIDKLGLQSLITDMTAGTTTFDPFPYPGNPVTIATKNDVARNSKAGAKNPFTTPDANWIPKGTQSKAYGPDGSYIDTGDPRGRDIHGGGSRLQDPFAPKQGWVPTMGCTRGQNEDIKRLGEAISNFKRNNPGIAVPYTRR